MFFTFLKLHKWFKIEQKVSYSLQDMSYPKNTHLKSNIIPILPFSIFIFRYNKTVNKWKITHMWRNISVWYLLMNLKNNYFFKKLLIWANIKCKNFNIYNKTLNRYQEITLMYQKSWWNDLQLLRYKVWQTEIGNYGSFFALLPPPPVLSHLKTQKIRTLKKWKKLLEIPSFYKSVSKTAIMRYGSWDMEHNRQNFLSFWTIFCPFTHLTTQKIKILKKWKKCPDILSF